MTTRPLPSGLRAPVMRAGLLAGALLAVAAAGGCRSLAKDPPKIISYALPPVGSDRLRDVGAGVRARHGEDACGFRPIDRNQEALEWRLALIDSAERTIDAKYFIWHGDSSALLLDRLVKAADRGVRVRVLVDDLMLVDRDRGVALLNTHPNIEFRVYNPWNTRDGGWLSRGLEAITRFDQVNHRMHNKLLVADNQVAIVGGRNVGDRYFGLKEDFNVRDFDVVVAGPIVPDLSRSFDEYWNSELAYPGDQMMKSVDGSDLPEVYEILAEAIDERRDTLQSFPLAPRDWSAELAALPDEMYPGTARLIYDEATDEGDEFEGTMVNELRRFTRDARSEILISTPYLIVLDSPMQQTRDAIERGVTVRVLTNSLATNDSELAYSGYRKDRRDLLETGMELFELRADATSDDVSNTPPVEGEFLALHSKLIVVDRERLYVGTFNIDPRSSFINSEMGMLIDSPGLARAAAAILDRDMGPSNAWRVRLEDSGRISWESVEGKTYEAPARALDQRFKDFFFGLFPIEDQL